MLLNESGKWTFSKIAEDYDAVRPHYPSELIQTLLRETGISGSARVLEIGCGTGQLTRYLAPYGFQIQAIDIGAALIEIAQKHCRAFPGVQFVQSAFEDFPIPDERFDLIVSATAFHWLDPSVRFEKSAALLKAGGHLAVINNVSLYQQHKGAIRQQLDEIYERVIPRKNAAQYVSLASKRGGLKQEFQNCPWLEEFKSFSFPYTHQLSAADYIRLLNTFSYQHNLPPDVKHQLFEEIESAVRADGDQIALPYEAVLMLGTKRTRTN